MKHPSPTHYFDDFLDYYERAARLENRNHRGVPLKTSGCPLQDSVSIYDTVHRRYAGFSNILRDLHSGKIPAGFQGPSIDTIRGWTLSEWLLIYGVHRMTGSGASFYPKTEGPQRHGYCNTPIFDIAQGRNVQEILDRLYDRLEIRKEVSYTSLGNQPPPFPSPANGYTKAGAYYLCEIWPQLIEEIVLSFEGIGTPWSVDAFTDWVLDLNVKRGFKRFKFTMTAFVMDIADWHPQFVTPYSQCYYGENCIRAMNAMFSEDNKRKGKKFYHEAMAFTIPYCTEILNDLGLDEEAAPMDVEDVMCDAVRYWSRFVPRHGYDHLTPSDTDSVSKVDPVEFANFLSTI